MNRIRAVVESNSITLAAQCGFQPEWLRVGTAGNLVVTPKTDQGNDVTLIVNVGDYVPANDILYVKTGSTAGGFTGIG